MTADDLLKRINPTLLYPPFLKKYRQLLENCIKKGAVYYATNGIRTFDEQAKLYAYGRTDMSRGIVTKAPPGYSAHAYGIAVDSCRDGDPGKDGLQPAWDIAQYKTLGEEAQKLGLDAAYFWQNFKEGPHVNLNIKKYGISWPTMIKTLKDGGMLGVFSYLDGFDWEK